MYSTTYPVSDTVPTVHVCPVCGSSFTSAPALSAHYRGMALID